MKTAPSLSKCAKLSPPTWRRLDAQFSNKCSAYADFLCIPPSLQWWLKKTKQKTKQKNKNNCSAKLNVFDLVPALPPASLSFFFTSCAV